jgi:hypothetical protein
VIVILGVGGKLSMIQNCKKCGKQFSIENSIFCSVDCALDYSLNKAIIDYA